MFKIGDKVRIIICDTKPPAYVRNMVGSVGVITEINELVWLDDTGFGVDFKRDIGGHNLNGTCGPYHGLYFMHKYLELVKPEPRTLWDI